MPRVSPLAAQLSTAHAEINTLHLRIAELEKECAAERGTLNLERESWETQGSALTTALMKIREDMEAANVERLRQTEELKDQIYILQEARDTLSSEKETLQIQLSEWTERTRRAEYWLSVTERQNNRWQERHGNLDMEHRELLDAHRRPVRYILKRMVANVPREMIYIGTNPRQNPEEFMSVSQ